MMTEMLEIPDAVRAVIAGMEALPVAPVYVRRAPAAGAGRAQAAARAVPVSAADAEASWRRSTIHAMRNAPREKDDADYEKIIAIVNKIVLSTLVAKTAEVVTILGTRDADFRIRVVNFEALFCENPVDTDPARPYQFRVDKHIELKFTRWKSVFAAMLVKKAKQTMGNVDDCDVVMQASNAYRQEQDCFAEFIRACVTDAAKGTVKQNDLIDTFGTWWKRNHSAESRPPNSKDLLQYITRRYGSKMSPPGSTPYWHGIALVRMDDDLEADPKGI
jgi:hypothetical protein